MKKIIAVLFLFVLSFPGLALAGGECMSDADCPSGESCVIAMCACAGCAEGEECLPCECEEEGFCMADGDDDPVDGYWLETECASDADCPMGFKCEAVEMGCGGGAACPPCEVPVCPEGTECEPVECPPCEEEFFEECEAETVNMCTYSPVECSADSDCPADWQCETYSTGGTVCSDCACACPAEGECPPCDCESSCEEVPGEEYSFCVPKEIECSANSDCPTDWTCEIMVYDAGCGCTCAAPACDPDDGECPEFECPECECPEPTMPSTGYCFPGGWGVVAQAGAENYRGDTAMSPVGAMPVSMDGEELAAVEKGASNNDGAVDEATSDSGCSMSDKGNAAVALMLAGLALALGFLRRRFN